MGISGKDAGGGYCRLGVIRKHLHSNFFSSGTSVSHPNVADIQTTLLETMNQIVWLTLSFSERDKCGELWDWACMHEASDTGNILPRVLWRHNLQGVVIWLLHRNKSLTRLRNGVQLLRTTGHWLQGKVIRRLHWNNSFGVWGVSSQRMPIRISGKNAWGGYAGWELSASNFILFFPLALVLLIHMLLT